MRERLIDMFPTITLANTKGCTDVNTKTISNHFVCTSLFSHCSHLWDLCIGKFGRITLSTFDLLIKRRLLCASLLKRISSVVGMSSLKQMGRCTTTRSVAVMQDKEVCIKRIWKPKFIHNSMRSFVRSITAVVKRDRTIPIFVSPEIPIPTACLFVNCYTCSYKVFIHYKSPFDSIYTVTIRAHQ